MHAPESAQEPAVMQPTPAETIKGEEILNERSAKCKAVATLIEPLAVDADGAAALFGVSPSHWHRMVAAGKAPPPSKLSRASRWSVERLRLWIALDAPSAAEFEARMAQERAQ